MKRQQTASAGDSDGGGTGPSTALASVTKRLHTLILTGELRHHSVHALETEIERCCAEGVSAITLDLRQLECIDPVGVAVIAFRARLCKRRGYEFALIEGPPAVHRAFEDAGVVDSLPFMSEHLDAVGANVASRQPSPRRLRAVT